MPADLGAQPRFLGQRRPQASTSSAAPPLWSRSELYLLKLKEEHTDALLIEVPEAAARLGISRAKLYEPIASGELTAVKVDGCRRIRTDDLRACVHYLTQSRRVSRSWSSGGNGSEPQG